MRRYAREFALRRIENKVVFQAVREEGIGRLMFSPAYFTFIYICLQAWVSSRLGTDAGRWLV